MRRDERDPVAKTAEQAKAQYFTPPAEFTDDWPAIAATLDGYSIAEELGFDLMEWAPEQLHSIQDGRKPELSLLELRLVLFYVYRSDYFGGGWSSHARYADDLFAAMAEQCGQHYRRRRSTADTFRLCLEYQSLSDAEKPRWLREQGVSASDLAEWERNIVGILDKYDESWV